MGCVETKIAKVGSDGTYLQTRPHVVRLLALLPRCLFAVAHGLVTANKPVSGNPPERVVAVAEKWSAPRDGGPARSLNGLAESMNRAKETFAGHAGQPALPTARYRYEVLTLA